MLRNIFISALLIAIVISTGFAQSVTSSFLPFEHRIRIEVEQNNVVFSTVPLVFLEVAGVSVFDVDQDGQLDIYLTNGPGFDNALLQDDQGLWADTAASLGINHFGGTAPLFGDIDNDGDDDLFIARRNKNALYRNDGGTFVNITDEAGVGGADQLSINASFCDFDNDGFLDIYVSNRRLHPTDQLHYNHLFYNNGDLTFTEIAHDVGTHDAVTVTRIEPGRGQNSSFASACFDYDADGDQDIAVAVDFSTITLFENQWRESGALMFENVTLEAGLGILGNWMGLAIADYNGDSHLDIFASNWGSSRNIFSSDIPVDTSDHALYISNGDGTFTNISGEAGVGNWPFGWGAVALDWENDGDQDIYFVGNMIEDVLNPIRGNAGYLFLNDGTAHFTESREAGLYDLTNDNEEGLYQVGHGVATGDLDDDGFFDIVVANSAYRDTDHHVYSGIPRLFLNANFTHPNSGNWIKVRLQGSSSNRNAVGARIYITIGDQVQVREVQAGAGRMAQSSLEIGFGLGDANIVDQLEIHWPSGRVEVIENLTTNQTLTISESGN
jgi:hypothetical protein